MRETQPLRPVVTVATIVFQDDSFLLVEEETRGGARFNQPAGHLEAGESLADAAARETLEETGYQVRPTELVGIYRWTASDTGATFIRFAFAAETTGHDPDRLLDTGILRALWLTYDELVACSADHRSPLVLRCVDDYLSGTRYPLRFITEM